MLKEFYESFSHREGKLRREREKPQVETRGFSLSGGQFVL